MIVSRSVADKLTVTFASDSEPEMPPDGEELAGPPLVELICCMKAPPPPVGSVAVAAEYPAPVVGPDYYAPN